LPWESRVQIFQIKSQPQQSPEFSFSSFILFLIFCNVVGLIDLYFR
jgi:hypothetical protein